MKKKPKFLYNIIKNWALRVSASSKFQLQLSVTQNVIILLIINISGLMKKFTNEFCMKNPLNTLLCFLQDARFEEASIQFYLVYFYAI